jgi:hypothetical protein
MDLLAPLAETPIARALIASSVLYLLVNAGHIIGIATLFGAILALDLRLLGLAPTVPLASVAPYLSRLAALGFGVAALTGFCLFTVRPTEYAANPAFLTKLCLISLGLINVFVVHRSEGWRHLAGGHIGIGLRISGVFSILFWTSAIIAGRWIGFL